MALLEVKGLRVAYGKAEVLREIDFSLAAGEVVGIIGPNGAGKTTLLRAIAGLISGQGSIAFEGHPIGGLPAHQVVAMGVVLCPERRRLFPEMTAWRNLAMGAYLRKDRDGIRRDLEMVQELFPGLQRRIDSLAGNLSGGEQQMLAVARALMSRPKLLMLDEPSFGLAPLVKKAITRTLGEIRKQGITILLAEQDSRLAFESVERVHVLENGMINQVGTPQELMADPQIKEAYLGLA